MSGVAATVAAVRPEPQRQTGPAPLATRLAAVPRLSLPSRRSRVSRSRSRRRAECRRRGPRLDAVSGEVAGRGRAVDVDEGGGEEDAHVAAGRGDDLVVVAAVDAGEVVGLQGDHVRGAEVVLHLQRRHVVPRTVVVIRCSGSRADGLSGDADQRSVELARFGRGLGQRFRVGHGEVEVAAVLVAAEEADVLVGLVAVVLALGRIAEPHDGLELAGVGVCAELVRVARGALVRE